MTDKLITQTSPTTYMLYATVRHN